MEMNEWYVCARLSVTTKLSVQIDTLVARCSFLLRMPVFAQGPLSSLFTAQLLVWASMCSIKKSESHCTHLRQDLQVTDMEITWLTFLATRRDTFVLPAPNCDGYIRKVRSDNGTIIELRTWPFVYICDKV